MTDVCFDLFIRLLRVGKVGAEVDAVRSFGEISVRVSVDSFCMAVHEREVTAALMHVAAFATHRNDSRDAALPPGSAIGSDRGFSRSDDSSQRDGQSAGSCGISKTARLLVAGIDLSSASRVGGVVGDTRKGRALVSDAVVRPEFGHREVRSQIVVVAVDGFRSFLESVLRPRGASHGSVGFDLSGERSAIFHVGLNDGDPSSVSSGYAASGASGDAVAFAFIPRNDGFIEVLGVHDNRSADLSAIGEAGDCASFFSSLCEDREKNRGEDGDNGDDDKQLDERKSGSVGFRVV